MTEETTRAFLLRLWELQAEQGITNAQLARRIGVSPSYVRKLKTRARVVRLGFHIALAAAREFPELALFLGSDLPTSNPILADTPEGTEEGASQ